MKAKERNDLILKITNDLLEKHGHIWTIGSITKTVINSIKSF